MANRTIADRIHDAHLTGKEAEFIGTDGDTYTFDPEGLKDYIGTGGGGGAVSSVNGQTGDVVITATGIGAATDDVATPSTDGLLSSEDKTKMDSIEDQGTDPIVILCSGQSNMAERYSGTFNWSDRIKYWNWPEYTQNTGTAFTAFSNTQINIPMTFASQIQEKYPNRDIYVINISWSAAPIAQWIDPQATDYLWTTLVNNVNAALSVAGRTKIDYFIWWQGEADVTTEDADWGAYRSKWETMYSQLTSNSWADGNTLNTYIFAIAGSPKNNWRDYSKMNTSLQSLVGARSDTRRYINTAQLVEPGAWTEDNVHISAAGQVLLMPMIRRVLDGWGSVYPPPSKNLYLGGQVVGSTTAGTATFTRQTDFGDQDGRRETHTIVSAWTGHTGTGQMRIKDIFGNQNGFGMEIPLPLNYQGITVTGTLIAVWEMWTSDIIFYVRAADGTQTPFDVPEDGSIAILASVITNINGA